MAIYLRPDHFRTACERRGWITAAQQAQQVGLSRSSLFRILQGAQTPRLDTVATILGVLGLPFHDLFEERPTPVMDMGQRSGPMGRSAG